MQMRTDLAMEAATKRGSLSPEDVALTKQTIDGIHFTRMRILSDRGVRLLQKPRGQYVTAELPPLTDTVHELLPWAYLLGREIAALLPPTGSILVWGLGNARLTADALGPCTARRVVATRHLQGKPAKAADLEDLRSTAVLSPGVCGETGVDSVEFIRGICQSLHPAAVIAVDALAAQSERHLGRTVQLTDSGIAPGSGVGNHRAAISEAELGVPVIALGVPTVIDARTLIADLTGVELSAHTMPRPLMVTPQEIDRLVDRAARLLAMSIHAALHPRYSPADLLQVTE